ncbi:MAG: RNA polymerase sigma factor [Actinomycetota bacterium]
MALQSKVAEVFAEEWPVLVATLARDLGDLGLAEESAQDAFIEAAARWGPESTPDKPGAWLLTTARRKAIDTIRRQQRFTDRLPALLELANVPPPEPHRLVDDQLALVFGCCHQSLNTEAQIALTLRQVCGLSTAQIAQAFLVSEATMAKRLVRAKDKIRKAKVPLSVPEPEQLGDRLTAVLGVVYLIFTAGHTAPDGPGLVRGDLCDEAMWLADVVAELLGRREAAEPPVIDVTDDATQRADHADSARSALIDGRAETLGLRALMLFTDARRAGRLDERGELVLLEDQDRSQWDRAMIDQGHDVLGDALALNRIGPYQLQAAIAGAHSSAATWADTDWRSIVWMYGRLARLNPSPVVLLNRAVAISMAQGPEAGLGAIDEILARGHLGDYRYAHAARADLLRRLDRTDDARAAYERALALGGNEAEQQFLRRRIADLS